MKILYERRCYESNILMPCVGILSFIEGEVVNRDWTHNKWQVKEKVNEQNKL